jgi:hypothetical protein
MSLSTRSWVEVGSVLALIGGLALVAAQIKQSTDITRVQLATSVNQNWRTVDGTRQSEEFARVLAKSIEQPQDLTLAEFLELDAYYLGVVDQFGALALHLESGYRETNLETAYANNALLYFGNPFARAWAVRHFSRHKSSRDLNWVEVLLAAIEQVDADATEARYRGVLQDIK